jgi:hypothetical protein
LTYLSTSLAFLARALASVPLRRITRAVLASISSTLWDNVLNRYRFSTAGAAQLQADLVAICRVVDQAVGPGVAESGLRKCLEGAQLVGLPVKGGKYQAARGSGDGGEGEDENEDDWETSWGGAEGDEAQSPQKANQGDTASDSGDHGLWEVERRLFADNASARDVLDELGMELLSETEARALLRRRVELAA